jgi:succinyldiaminopimelate transaminase
VSLTLPDFPWDSLESHRDRASAHPHGLIDLSVGSPIDPTPAVATKPLQDAAQAPSYPLTAGTPELRAAMAAWWERRRNTGPLDALEVMPSIGSKEMVGLLPTLLGVRSTDVVVIPKIAYPTYAMGAHMVGARVVASDDPAEWPEGTKLVWLNSPGNPTGRVHDVAYLREALSVARRLGAVIASDECYGELGWDGIPVPSLLDHEVTQGDRSGAIALYSTSKQSNLAGYRAALVAGDQKLIQELLLARKHLGLIVPAPIQAALTKVLGDDEHVATQKERYRVRRELVRDALLQAGFRIERSEAGLYLWATRDEDCWDTVSWCAERGVLVAPGSFYGEAGSGHVRVALTVSDEHAEAVRDRFLA